MLLSLIALSATGCVTGSASSCTGYKPIRPLASDVDAVSPELARKILDHNEFGRERCGWGASGGVPR